MAEVSEVTTTSPEELLAAGRRHLAVRNYSLASENLSQACEILAKDYGDMADECGEAYLWYGKALLGLSREENGVLGEAVPGDNKDDEEENEEENGENSNAEEHTETEKENEETEKAVVEKIEAESTTKDDEPESSVAESAEEQPGTSNGDAHDESVVNMDDEEACEEIDNLQLAWEMLDVSRNILLRRALNGTEAARGLLADVHLALGEVALESETYDKAVIEMMSCLEIQKELYRSDDRRIAETHYQIGLANSLASSFEDAITHFKNAANILESRIKTLENPASVAEDATVKKYSTSDPFYTVEAELKELKELLPEIQEKIQDMMDYKTETIKRVRETLCPSNGAGSQASSSTKTEAKPAANISHLIKRKRKNSDEETPASKRVNT